MAFENSPHQSNVHLFGSTHGGSHEMPFLPQEAMCCQYRTFIFFSKDSEDVIFGHTADCNIHQSIVDHDAAHFFPIHRNGPFEGSVPVVETTPNPPIIRRTPKWTDDGEPILWFVNFKKIENLLHPLALKKYEQKKCNTKDDEESNDEKDDKTGEVEERYVNKATQTDGNEVGLENKNKVDGGNKDFGHANLFNADGEDVSGSARRPRRMMAVENEFRSQLRPLGIYPSYSEDDCEEDDPDHYELQQRRSELDHFAMDSATTLVARPLQSYDPRSPRESRYHMRRYPRPSNRGTYCLQGVELHHEHHDVNASTAQQSRGIREGALPYVEQDISDDGQSIIFRERDCKCVKYMTHRYGQPIEPVPSEHEDICEKHDPNLQSRLPQNLWAEKDTKIKSLRGGTSQATAAKENHKKEVSMELEMMSGGYDAPMFATVYENKLEEKPNQPRSLDALAYPEKITDNKNERSASLSLRRGEMDGCDERSGAFADMRDESESTAVSDLFDRAKEIKTRFENIGRPRPSEGNNRLKINSFIEALRNPLQDAEQASSTSTGCASCPNLTDQRRRKWEEQALEKTIKEMQREYNRMDIRSCEITAEKEEFEMWKKKVMMKERALVEQKLLLEAAQDSFKRDFSTQRGESEGLRAEAAQHKKRTSRIQPISRSNRSVRQEDHPTDATSRDRLDMLLEVLQDWKQGPASLQKNVDDLNDEPFTERDTYIDKWIYSQGHAVKLKKENTELRRQLQFRDESIQQRMSFIQQGYPAAFFGAPNGWVPGSIKQQYTGAAATEDQQDAFERRLKLPSPLNHSFLYQRFPAQAQYGEMSPQQTQPFSQVHNSAMARLVASGRSFIPQPSEPLLANDGLDPEGFMT